MNLKKVKQLCSALFSSFFPLFVRIGGSRKFRLPVLCTLQDMIQGRKSEFLRGVTELYIETLNQAHSQRAICNAL